ncbi:MAG TPA: hypothetical protein VLE48_07335 [Terriglobales bacterium]|nr:hypothetical protein [Terriglobales bacterium]
MLARLVALLCVLALSPALVFSQPPPNLGKVKDQTVYAPFWSLEPGWSTHLEVRNSLAEKRVTVTPVLRQFTGREILLTTRTLEANQALEIDVEQEVAKAAPELSQRVGAYGSVLFRFSGTHTRNIYADSMVYMPGHPIAFHFDALMQDANFAAGSQESVWWLPTETASEVLIVTNTGDRPVQGAIELYGPDGTASQRKLAFGPGQTAKLDVRELLRSGNIEGAFGGLRLTLDADGGLIQVAHIVYDEATGYSAIIKPFDRGAPTDIAGQQYVAAMVALANPDPALALPEKTVLNPELLLRNASAGIRGVTLSASWREGNKWGVADLGQVQLGSNETRSVDLSTYQQDGIIPAGAHWAAVRLNYRGARGDLVAISATHDPAFRYVLQSPFTDALSFSWRGSMWSVDSTHNSLITTGNAGDKPARVKATLRHALGSYELTEQTLQPGESIWLNVRQLIQNQIPDREGRTIPLNTTNGIYEFDQVDDDMVGFLYEGKLILDSTYGRATYGCANCCGYDALGLAPNPLGIAVGFSRQDEIYVENACTGAITTRTSYGFNWATGNSTIAGINSTGLVSAFTSGQTTSAANISLRTPGVPFCPQQVQQVSNNVDAKCAVPTNFRKISSFGSPDGKLTITYAWDSSTGVLSDLSNCVISEIVNYPTSNSTYIWPAPMVQSTPNPTVVTGPGSSGGFADAHIPPSSFATPYSTASFTANQVYRYTCSCANNGNPVDMASFTITRSVSQNADGTWRYTITKSSGESHSRSPLP